MKASGGKKGTRPKKRLWEDVSLKMFAIAKETATVGNDGTMIKLNSERMNICAHISLEKDNQVI
jgi:hypothetical protein